MKVVSKVKGGVKTLKGGRGTRRSRKPEGLGRRRERRSSARPRRKQSDQRDEEESSKREIASEYAAAEADLYEPYPDEAYDNGLDDSDIVGEGYEDNGMNSGYERVSWVN